MMTSLALDAAQSEVVLREIEALAASLAPDARARYTPLAAAVGAGEVEEGLVARLEEVLDLSLGTGRARRIHGAEGEQALLRLFRQTPRGVALARTVEDANRALSALTGQVIQGLFFTPRAPGAFRLEISTAACQVTLEIDRSGVTVDSVGVEV
ncbi:MAG: hypothetical protein QOJ16_1877 [Acidobacteriota bacterium]|jgi:hypothetical protein|nr:hypothetical protein [Acidobacteriota bacterium]